MDAMENLNKNHIIYTFILVLFEEKRFFIHIMLLLDQNVLSILYSLSTLLL